LNSDFIVIAKVGSPKGLKGELKLNILSEGSLDIFKELYLFSPRDYENYKSNENNFIKIDKKLIKLSGKSLIKIPNIDSPEDARKYTHYLLCVKTGELPKLDDNEYYWQDLEGLSVYNKEGAYLGDVDYLMETGSNDVMFLVDKTNKDKKEVKTRCLPFMEPVLISVDLVGSKVIVDWDEDF
jgi:16S rRNA processing protein RimM